MDYQIYFSKLFSLLPELKTMMRRDYQLPINLAMRNIEEEDNYGAEEE